MSKKSELTACLDDLRQQVRAEVAAGHMHAALDLSTQSIDIAERLDDRDRIDIERCNRAGILVALGRGDEVITQLRGLLMRASSAHLQFLAAYKIAEYHELRQELERSRFYIQLALDHAQRSGEPANLAMAHVELARLHMLDSSFADARQNFDQALELMPDDSLLERAIVLSNLGYCQTVLGGLRDAFLSLSRSLRLLRRLKNQGWQRLPHLGLSNAYLEVGRYRRARSHAQRALVLSEGVGDGDEHLKNSLYLLGESEKMLNNPVAAYEHFHHLQTRFYPNEPFVIDVLMATDIRKLINLMA